MTKTTINEILVGIETALQSWLDFHSNPQRWAEAWVADYDDLDTFINDNPELGNTYWHFNIKDQCNAQWISENLVKCSECGMLYDDGFHCDDCDESEMTDVNFNDALEFVEDTRFSYRDIPSHLIMDVLTDKAFPTYFEEVVLRFVSDVIDTVESALELIRGSESNTDWLMNCMSTLGIMHHSGNIFQDYAEEAGIPYELIDTIREDGLAGIFSREEIREFMNS